MSFRLLSGVLLGSPAVDLLVEEILDDHVSSNRAPHVCVVDLRLLEVGRKVELKGQIDGGLDLILAEAEVPV